MQKISSIGKPHYIYPVQVLQDISQHHLPRHHLARERKTTAGPSFRDWLTMETKQRILLMEREQHSDIRNMCSYYTELSAP